MNQAHATAPMPVVHAGMDFDEASSLVVEYLRAAVPMGFWAVTRCDEHQQVYLEVRDDAYGLAAGDSCPWEDSFCIHMVEGRAPEIAPDAMAVSAFAAAPAASELQIGAYIGIPIRAADGTLFGTLCGIDPATRSAELEAQRPLLGLLVGLLTAILEADRARTELARQVDRMADAAETDQLTRLLNRRGWERHVALEEARHARFGDPAAVIVLDLDGLKGINDQQGHESGDRYLVSAAQALAAAVRPTDIVARLGGDEFGVLLPNTDSRSCLTVVDRIHAALFAGGVSGSVGHAPYTVVAGFPGAIASADARMYEAKRVRQAR